MFQTGQRLCRSFKTYYKNITVDDNEALQRVLANRGIFPGIFPRISVEMVLAGLKGGYP